MKITVITVKTCSILLTLPQALSEQEVVHFDLKCDNVLLDMLPGASIEDFWRPTTDQPAFRVVLADFGDSCDFSQSENKFTTRQKPAYLDFKDSCDINQLDNKSALLKQKAAISACSLTLGQCHDFWSDERQVDN